ncbi:MAG: signal peptidase I [Chloroflexi bacterium]|nr:signal peptidase I [Chloroflexota bacterium]
MRVRAVRRTQPSGVNWVREALETFLPALLLAILIHIFLAQATQVLGVSMEPTLHGRERLIIEKVSYRFHPPRRGDIVVLSDPRYGPEPLIKRVVGLPGEVIAIENGRVLINGQPYDEPYLNGVMRADFPATVVPEGHVFVMGDNRNNSNDSRSFGPAPISNIIGRAWLRYWPLSAWRFFP